MSSRNQNDIAKATKKSIIGDLCIRIDHEKKANNNRVPMGFIAGLVRSHVAVCPWLSRDSLNNEMRRRASSGNALIDSVRANQITTSVTDLVVARNTGGRPGGSSDAKKRNVEKVVIAAKNEICEQYNKDKSNVDVNKKLPRGHLTNIISRVKRKYELGHDINITVACIRQRFKKSCLILESARPFHSITRSNDAIICCSCAMPV